MTDINRGVYGATGEAQEESNPKDFFIRLREGYLDLDKEKFVSILVDAIREEENIDFLCAALRYWGRNTWNAVVKKVLTVEEIAAEKIEKQAQTEFVRATIKRQIKRVAEVMLLDMLLPNGKLLRDCTGKYVQGLGGGLMRIGAAVKPDQIIGKALNEKEVRELYNGG